MIHIPKYPKILALGHRTIKNVFDGEVEVTEKIDGSQFSFVKVDGELICRSKKKVLVNEAVDKLFEPAVKKVQEVKDEIPEGYVFFGETLMKPKHNTLEYSRVPKGNVALFGMMDMTTQEMQPHFVFSAWADRFDMDTVPILHFGQVNKPESLKELLELESYLGKTKIEGFVVKNYGLDALIGDVYYPYLVGKFVSEKFKEKHDKGQYGNRKRKQSLDEFIKSYRTEARWRKAVQHFKEEGKLVGEPKDIGPLIKEIQSDLVEECKEEILDWLWKEYSKQIMGTVIHGFPEKYKEWLFSGELDG